MIARSPNRRRGAVLVLTLIIIFALAAMVLALGYAASRNLKVAANVAARREAAVALRGGEQYVMALLKQSRQSEQDAVELLPQSSFEAVPIGNGYVWIVRPDYNDPLLPPFGLVDESTKIDLNTEDIQRLMQLEGMTGELATAIVDWRDEDDEVSFGVGAESGEYLAGSPSYRAKNAPLESVEELLMLRGWTPELLFGPADQGPLGVAGGAGGGFTTQHWQRRGFFDLFTVWSHEPRLAPDGSARINSDGDEDELRDLVTRVIGGDRATQINARMNDQGNIFLLAQRTGMTEQELRQLEPYLYGGGDGFNDYRGKINLNYAPREVLLAADEDADASLVDNAIITRKAQTEIYPGTIAWLLNASGQAVVQLDDDVIARGTHWSADIVAASADGRAWRRARIVIDNSGNEPQIVFRRDLTERGWPLEPAILDNLRDGAAPQ